MYGWKFFIFEVFENFIWTYWSVKFSWEDFCNVLLVFLDEKQLLKSSKGGIFIGNFSFASPKTSQKGPIGTTQDHKNYFFDMSGYENPVIEEKKRILNYLK